MRVAVIVVVLFVLVLVGNCGVNAGTAPAGAALDAGPSGAALAGIPASTLAIYRDAGRRYGIDWAILAAIGSIETDHGRSTAPGVRSGVNSYGCCAGPMQFMVTGANGGTWGAYGEGGDVYALEDAIPAAARYLKAAGAPGDYRAAIFAYNHAGWYVAQVLEKAALYRAAGETPEGGEATPLTEGMTPKEVIDKIVLPLAHANGIPITVAEVEVANERHSTNTSSGNVSDHKGPPKVAWAADISDNWASTNGSPNMTALADTVARRFKIRWPGQGLVSATIGAYRFQLIYLTSQGGNHFNHVHIGVKVT